MEEGKNCTPLSIYSTNGMDARTTVPKYTYIHTYILGTVLALECTGIVLVHSTHTFKSLFMPPSNFECSQNCFIPYIYIEIACSIFFFFRFLVFKCLWAHEPVWHCRTDLGRCLGCYSRETLPGKQQCKHCEINSFRFGRLIRLIKVWIQNVVRHLINTRNFHIHGLAERRFDMADGVQNRQVPETKGRS